MLGQFAGDGQAQSGASVAAHGGGVHLTELLKQLRQLLLTKTLMS
jgi:hypothetical protein